MSRGACFFVGFLLTMGVGTLQKKGMRMKNGKANGEGDGLLPKPVVNRSPQGTSLGVAPPPSAPIPPPEYVRDERTPVEDVFYFSCVKHGQMALPEGARKCPQCGLDIVKVGFTPPTSPAPTAPAAPVSPQPIALSITVQAVPAPQAPAEPSPPAPTVQPSGQMKTEPAPLPAASKRPRLPTNVEITLDMLLGSENESPQDRWERYLFYAGAVLLIALIVAGIVYTIVR